MSRNAAFQNAVSKASGVKLALEGDLIRYDSKRAGKTELATRKLAELGMSDSEIRRQLEKGDSFSFEETALYKKVYQLAEAKTGKITTPRNVAWHSILKARNYRTDYGLVCEARRRTAGALYETVIKQARHAR